MKMKKKKKPRGCNVKFCRGKHLAKGLCSKHYYEMKRSGKITSGILKTKKKVAKKAKNKPALKPKEKLKKLDLKKYSLDEIANALFACPKIISGLLVRRENNEAIVTEFGDKARTYATCKEYVIKKEEGMRRMFHQSN